MTLLPGEHLITTSDTGEFVLTTLRVRQVVEAQGRSQLTSLFLSEITLVSVSRRTKPFLMYLAVILGVFALLVFISTGLGSFGVLVAILSAVSAFVYRRSRFEALMISSAFGSIELDVREMAFENVVEIVDKIEGAKALAMTKRAH